ncbi:MAG: glycosyltransferase family 61 protein [Lentisphaeria bacterium]|nr:glycosyltransferase family 61 protein [Lentisphaeria bacterium]
MLGFCMGFTLGNPKLKLFDDWRFFNPNLPFGGNEFNFQKRIKKRSAKAECHIVTDCWVSHHLNRGWKDKPSHPDPYDPMISRSSFLPRHVQGPQRPNYVTEFCDENISHCLRLEILPLGVLDPCELKQSDIHIVQDNIERYRLQHDWRLFLLSTIFHRVNYIRADNVGDIANPILLDTKKGYKHHKFINYTPNADYIRLSEFIKKNAGIEAPEENYVLLNQRPEGNRYLMESSSGLPLEEYLRDALGKRGIRFRSCDFSTMRPTEQVQICLGAKVFISAHGAAFANVVFTPPRCLMLEYNFRKYWNCDPACDAHFHGRLADHKKCDGIFTRRAHFHKADFHNLCHLLGRPYSEMEVVRYGEFYNRNPICRSYMFVDGAALLSEIEAAVALSDKDLEKMEKK